MKIFRGRKAGVDCVVELADEGYTTQLSLEKILKVVDHSSTGFQWCHQGSGPAQLAAAILIAKGIKDNDELLKIRHENPLQTPSTNSLCPNMTQPACLNTDGQTPQSHTPHPVLCSAFPRDSHIPAPIGKFYRSVSNYRQKTAISALTGFFRERLGLKS